MIRSLLTALAFGAVMVAQAPAMAKDFLAIELKSGTVKIELMEDIAPKHVAQIKAIAEKGGYDGVGFHRVIEGFMAQTGDVEHGKIGADGGVSPRAGTGGSDLPDIPAEFSNVPFDRGMVGMARSQNPNSANSQFFIMFADGHFLNNQYTVFGKVVEGMQHVDNIKLGSRADNGSVAQPDQMISVKVISE